MHPTWTEAEEIELKRQIKVSKQVMSLAAALLPLGPRLDLSEVELVRPSRLSSSPSVPALPGHQWMRMRGFFLCSSCNRVRRGTIDPPPGHCTEVHGLTASALVALSHRCLSLECSDGALLTVCLKCRSYSSHGQIRGLSKACAPPTRHTQDNWKLILRGKHPKRPGVTVETGPWSAL